MNIIEKEIESRLKCAKCHNTGASVKSLAMTGTGASRFLNVQLLGCLGAADGQLLGGSVSTFLHRCPCNRMRLHSRLIVT